MAEYLSEEWLTLLAEKGGALPALPGMSLVMNYEVAEVPERKKVRYHVVIDDGRVSEVADGKHKEPDVVVAMKYKDAIRIESGELSHDVGFQQGRFKVDGSYEKWLWELRPLTTSEPWKSFLATMYAETEFV